MITTIKIYKDKKLQISIAKVVHFHCLDLNKGVLKLLPQHKSYLFNFVYGISRMLYPLKASKRCPSITIWSNFPILSPYCFITFEDSPFTVLNDAAQMIILEETLSEPDKYQNIQNNIIEYYSNKYPKAYFDVRIFSEKYHGVKGYFVFIDDTTSCALFWGYDDPFDEEILDTTLFEEK